jgi:hypothetical protein
VNPSHILHIKSRSIIIFLQWFALSNMPMRFIRHYLAHHGKTGRIRLEAARRINADALMAQMAHQAAEEGIRLKAALDTGAQAALTAIALRAWDIDMGTRAVDRITSRFSLMRIARSACQDTIRLHAAMRLESPRLLRQLADAIQDIHARWQIAKVLDDPFLLAQISLFKKTNIHLAPLRAQAHQALLGHLEGLAKKGDHAALRAILLTQSDLSIRLEVFTRIGADYIDHEVLSAFSRDNFAHVPGHLIRQLLAKIKAAGWQVARDEKWIDCRHCRGKGTLAYRSISAHHTHHPHGPQLEKEVLPCVECNATGRVKKHLITCVRDDCNSVVLTLPVDRQDYS